MQSAVQQATAPDSNICGLSNPKKRHAPYSNSVGNSSKLQQQKKGGAAAIEKVELLKDRCVDSPASILAVLSNLSNCCSGGGINGCLLNIHVGADGVVDYNAAIAMVRQYRNRMLLKTDHEKQSFVQDRFRESILNEKVKTDGTTEYEMCYKINDRIVCKKGFSKAFGFTVKALEKCSKILKGAPTGKVYSLATKTYTDAHIHDYTYAETAQMFRDNIPGEVVDCNMVRACLTPSSEVQADCVYWLDQYFNTYGDCIPNSENEIKLAIIRKKEIYTKYAKNQSDMDPPKRSVSYPQFHSLWQSLFPNCQSRPWCGIPGKCETCCDIDKLRRTSEDSLVQKMCQQAHHLHKGGLIELQRKE